MSLDIKKYLMQACLRFLKPIVRFLIMGGVTHQEFTEASKTVFVQVARDNYGVDGRKTNMARVAILTGLSRKECLRIRRLLEDQTDTVPLKPNPAARVVTAWASDPDFLDDQGEPKVLPMEGTGSSFEELLRRYAGDLPHGALLKELERVEAVTEGDDGLELVRRSFIPGGFNHDKIRILATQLSDLGGTICHNLQEDIKPRMQRYVVNDTPLSSDAVARFQQVATERGQELLEQLDTWLTAAGNTDTVANHEHKRVGFGVYFFEEPADGEQHAS